MSDRHMSFRRELPDIYKEGVRLGREEEFGEVNGVRINSLRGLFAQRMDNMTDAFAHDLDRALEENGLHEAVTVTTDQLRDLYYRLRSGGWSHEQILAAAKK